MTRLEQLEDYAYSQNINIFKSRFLSSKKASCMQDNNYKLIAINMAEIESSDDELCVLAEEVGHIETGTLLPVNTYINPDYKKWLKRKNEILADRWAINEILPPSRIQQSIEDGCVSYSDIACCYDVTVEFVEKALLYYERKGIMFNSN